MKFAHFSHVWGKPNMTAHQRYEQLWRELELCDDLGFDYSFCVEHHFRPDESWMSSPALYAVAGGARTKRLRVGAMGFVVPLHNPLRLAEEIAIVDQMLGGRFECGLVPGISPGYFTPFGIDYNFRKSPTFEFVHYLRAAYGDKQPFAFHGDNHNTDSALLAVQPVQKPHPPIWMMSRDPATLEFCAKEGVNTGYFINAPRHEVGPRYQKYLAEWQAAGHQRKPNIAYSTVVYVDETDKAAIGNGLFRASRAYEGLLPVPEPGETFEDRLKRQKARFVARGEIGASNIVTRIFEPDFIMENDLVFIGSPETVTKKLRKAAEIGFFNTFMGEFNFADLPEADLMRSIRLFGEKVIPALRDYEPFLAPAKGVVLALTQARVALAPPAGPWHFGSMTDDLPLAAEFLPAIREDWLKLVRVALKDRPLERLTTKTYDGIPIEPLYARAADARPIAGRQGPWAVQARVDHPDPALANAEALHELANGATALTLVFAGSIGAYGYGLPGDAKSIARILEGVHLDAIAIELQTAEPTRDAADHIAALVKSRGHAPGTVDIRFGHDAIGAHSLTGTLPIPYRDLMPRFAEHVGSLAKQGFKSPLTAADGRIIHNAGGSEAQELAYVLAVAVAYLRALEGAGTALDAARSMIEFRLSADADQFLTIAKFRALRALWARVEQACGLDPKPAFISAETAWRMMTKRDPWVNMLRTTIAAFSAGVGGADALTVLPFTSALGLPDRFARRVARNAELLLLEESNVAKVADPTAGSGGIEALTDKLGRAAWALFQEIEGAGGAPAALQSGFIQEKVGKVRAAHEAATAIRKDALTGTTDFPNLAEAPVKVLDLKPVPLGAPVANITYPALAPIRLAEPFERLRDGSDRILAETGARPKIFLANLGTIAEFTARASFAKTFFEAGGIEAASNDGFPNRDAMVAAFKASRAKLACLCSADVVYERDAIEATKALQAAGATHIYLAGRPKDADALKAAGVGTFIFAGGDALATLKAAHDILAAESKR